MSGPEIFSAAQIALPQMATPAAPGSMVESLVSAGRSLASDVAKFRHLGLAMRFKVVADGINLGKWTSCDGLKVEFKYDAVRSGGNYSDTSILPTFVSFSPVTLKRAVEFEYSQRVLLWLSQVAVEWQNGTGIPDIGTTVTISLLDVYQNEEAPAMSWQLRKAFPVAWSGPSLSAKSTEIATETLVLEHDGFLEQPE